MHFLPPCEKRKTIFSKDNIEATLHLISDDLQMAELWAQFQKSNFYVGDLAWKNVIGYVENTMKKYLLWYEAYRRQRLAKKLMNHVVNHFERYEAYASWLQPGDRQESYHPLLSAWARLLCLCTAGGRSLNWRWDIESIKTAIIRILISAMAVFRTWKSERNV